MKKYPEPTTEPPTDETIEAWITRHGSYASA